MFFFAGTARIKRIILLRDVTDFGLEVGLKLVTTDTSHKLRGFTGVGGTVG